MVSARILRTELKRSAAPWVGGLVLVAGLGFLYTLSGPWTKGTQVWTGQWTPMARWVRYVLSIMWPLAVGAGALQGMRDHRSRMTELLATTPLPARHRAGKTAAAAALALAAAYVLVNVVGGVQVYANGGYAHLGWVPVALVGVLALVAGALLGMGAGRILPYVLTPPALAVVALVTTAFLQTSMSVRAVTAGAVPTRVALLSPALSQVDHALLTVAGRVNAGQTLWLLGMAATGFGLLIASGLRARLIALAPLALGAAVALVVLPSVPSGVYVVDEAAAAPVCDGPVCVTKLHERQLGGLAGPGDAALRTLHGLPRSLPHGLSYGRSGSQVPVSVRESTATGTTAEGRPQRSAKAVFVDFDDHLVADVKGKDLTRNLVAEGALPTCFGLDDGRPGKMREFAAQTVVAGWLLGDSGGHAEPLPGADSWTRSQSEPLARKAWTQLRAQPRAEQRARIAAARAATLSCGGDALKALGGDASR